MRYKNIIPSAISIAIVVIVIIIVQYQRPHRSGQSAIEVKPQLTTRDATTRIAHKELTYSRAKEITTPDGFINGDKTTIGDLVGKKVILVDFWTYSCINCQRTTPYLNAWYEKYKDKGLVIIGVHTPEFEFEKKYDNVRAAVEKAGIKFPVVLDNDFSTWTAYQNLYWPHKYLIDIDGFVVYDHIGEGGYEETEQKIQELLQERNQVLNINQNISSDLVVPVSSTHSRAAGVGSPETYFGAARNTYLGNGIPQRVGLQQFAGPADSLQANTLYLGGDWDITNQFAENKNLGAKILYRYQAKNVYLVAGSKNPVTIKVLKDGVFLKEITIQQEKLYPLIEDTQSGEHMLEIIINKPGLRAFTFTFG